MSVQQKFNPQNYLAINYFFNTWLALTSQYPISCDFLYFVAYYVVSKTLPLKNKTETFKVSNNLHQIQNRFYQLEYFSPKIHFLH